MDGFMTWEDIQGISPEQQLIDLAAEYQHMSALLDRAISEPEEFLRLCYRAQDEATKAMKEGNEWVISDWEHAADHNPTLENMVRTFTGQMIRAEMS